MIHPSGLLRHARASAGAGPGRPSDASLRRGVSAAYYAAFQYVTGLLADHLIGGPSSDAKAVLRRSWSHGEIKAACQLVVERAQVLEHNPGAHPTKEMRAAGPLIDLAAGDVHVVAAARIFEQLQDRRHDADYDHLAAVTKVALLEACKDVESLISELGAASTPAREALLSLLAIRRPDLSPGP